MKIIDSKSQKLAIIGILAGTLAAGLKRRQHLDVVHPSAHGNPVRLSGKDWKTALIGTKNALGDKHLPTLAAGVAYYSILALFPFLAAAVAIAALVISPEQLDALIRTTQEYLPADISSVIASQLQSLVSRRSDNIVAATIAIAIALFGASGASKNLVIASNVAYEVKESRGWLAQQAWGIIWTVAGIGFAVMTVALLAVNDALLEHFGLPPLVINTLLYGRWLILLAFSMFGLAVFYRYGPNRPRVRWQWVSWGAVLATTVWLITTSLFFVYVQNFANYTQSYSLFAGIVVLMIWMNLSALIVLLGAVVNHQLEIVGHKRWGGFLSGKAARAK